MPKNLSQAKSDPGKTSQEIIQNMIYIVRGQKVMIDVDLAVLYGVRTKRLNEQVKRNIKRFPEDFMFRLTEKEADFLRSQFATSKEGRGGRRYLPFAFTEQGVAMLSSVLTSDRAIEVNIAIMRAFVKLRRILSVHKDFLQKLNQLERKIEKHDEEIHLVFEAIRQLMAGPEKPKVKIGFHTD